MLKYDLIDLKMAASKRWPEIIERVTGVSADFFSGRKGPCPKCGGQDRFRFVDPDKGGAICSHCARTGLGDGLAIITWLNGRRFAEVVELAGDCLHLRILTKANGRKSQPGKGSAAATAVAPPSSPTPAAKHPVDPAKDLQFRPWNDLLVQSWCLRKKGTTPEAVKACGGRIARYRKKQMVIALPVHGEQLAASPPVGWCLYALSGGKIEVLVKKQDGSGYDRTYEKIKLTFGSQPGIIGDLKRLKAAAEIWKTEGPSDLMAFLSLPDLPAGAAAFATAFGCQEKPQTWMLDLFRGKRAIICHDADQPGEAGAVGWTDDKGQFRPGWCQRVAATASESRQAKLPYPVEPSHGKDLRDYLCEGFSFADCQKLAAAGQPFAAPAVLVGGELGEPLEEHDDSPLLLARENIESYRRQVQGCIRFWRQHFYTWRPDRGCYKQVSASEMQSKVRAAIEETFRRQCLAETARWKELRKTQPEHPDAQKAAPKLKKVKRVLTSDVMAAMESLCLLPDSVEMNSWILASDEPQPQPLQATKPPVSPKNRGSKTEKRTYIAVKNGLIDMEAVLAEQDNDTTRPAILPHHRAWFSTTCLPYDFDPEAKCPQWQAFLEHNLEMDPERIKLLQEWAGYLLTPDTSFQKFLILEGEGCNGKSVFCAAIGAMLGDENCSRVGLEQFAERFGKNTTLGKLVNIVADVGEVDKVAEGYLKSFVSGDTMFFDRKNLQGVNARPTARLMFACNNRPRFTDRSSGVWRRMLLVPWNVEISNEKVVRGMDNPLYWQQSGELPGILIWAIQGLDRLHQQGRFTESILSREALDDYRNEANPTRQFFSEYLEERREHGIISSKLYGLYCHWCEKTGHRPFSDKQFGKELQRFFKFTNRKKGGSRSARLYYYSDIGFSQDEIHGEKTYEADLFSSQGEF